MYLTDSKELDEYSAEMVRSQRRKEIASLKIISMPRSFLIPHVGPEPVLAEIERADNEQNTKIKRGGSFQL